MPHIMLKQLPAYWHELAVTVEANRARHSQLG
jgi:hypothetical protein